MPIDFSANFEQRDLIFQTAAGYMVTRTAPCHACKCAQLRPAALVAPQTRQDWPNGLVRAPPAFHA